MSNMRLEADLIIKNNPQTSAEAQQRVDALMERLDRLGIRGTGYRLASPFSLSLRKVHKGSRKNRACESE
jgi:hypothetical protein